MEERRSEPTVERLRDLEEWVKSARAQAGTFAHGRGGTGSPLSRGRELVQRLDDFMLRRGGAGITAAALLVLVAGANYLRGRAVSRRGRRARSGL